MATLQQRVWQDLSKIDCSDFTEQKNGLDVSVMGARLRHPDGSLA